MWALHLMDINLDRMAALKQAPFVIMKIPPWLKTLSTGTVVPHTYKIFVFTLYTFIGRLVFRLYQN